MKDVELILLVLISEMAVKSVVTEVRPFTPIYVNHIGDPQVSISLLLVTWTRYTLKHGLRSIINLFVDKVILR